MSYVELIEAQEDAKRLLEEMKDAGRELAQAERAYKVAKARKILSLRAKGYPATLIQDLVRGSQDIANLAFDRDCKAVLYNASNEAYLLAKKSVDVSKEIFIREYSGVQ